MIKPIPFTGGSLTVSECGVVFKHGVEIPQSKDNLGRNVVWLNWFNGEAFYDVAVLVAWAFKYKSAINLPPYYIHRVTVMFADGNSGNLSPENLVWKFPKERLLYPNDTDFAYIPGFTKYVINREGVLKNARFKGKEIKPFRAGRYYKFKLSSDENELVMVGRHRLVVLAWEDYPHTVNELVVNHIDGCPGNDQLGNLELITRLENNLHASKHGLTRKGRKLLVRDVRTGVVREFSGTTAYAREMGINRATVKYRVDSPGQPVFFPGVQLKYAYDPTPWRKIDPQELENLSPNKGLPTEIYSRNIFTGVVVKYKSVQSAASETGVPIMTIHAQLKGESPRRPLKGLDFLTTDGPWRTYTDLEKEMFKLSPKGRLYPCKVIDTITNEIKLFPNVGEVAKFCDVPTPSVYKHVGGNSLLCNRFKIEKYTI